MARPKKQTADYFPHIAKSGKTILMLESRWGNDGYAFWFKLLEILCQSNGHVSDYGNPVDREFILAKTRVTDETATEILNKLAEIEKIDKELWAEEKVIWCQSLLDNIKDAYSKRINDLPAKPSLRSNKPPKTEFPTPETPSMRVSDDGSTESKVKESKGKVKEIKLNQNKVVFDYTENLYLLEAINGFIAMRTTIKKPMTERAIALMLKKLDELGKTDSDKIEILNQSTMNCWQGIFELRQQGKANRQQTASSMADEAIRGLYSD